MICSRFFSFWSLVFIFAFIAAGFISPLGANAAQVEKDGQKGPSIASARSNMETRLQQARIAHLRLPADVGARVELATMLNFMCFFRADKASGDADLMEAYALLLPLTESVEQPTRDEPGFRFWLVLGHSATTLLQRNQGDAKSYALTLAVLEKERALPPAALEDMRGARGLLASALAVHTKDPAQRAVLFAEAYTALRTLPPARGSITLYAQALGNEARLSQDPAVKTQRYAEAEEQYRKVAAMEEDSTLPAKLVEDQWALMLLHRAGDSSAGAEREAYLAQAAAKANVPHTRAAIAAFKGDAPGCVRILRENMIQDNEFKQRLAADPLFTSVRDTPEFQAFLSGK